jgi:hypothetical protein
MRVNWREKLEATESGRAVLRVEGVVDEEVAEIQKALNPEQLSEIGTGALRAGLGVWSDLERRWRDWGRD